jgi:hypothetical protein
MHARRGAPQHGTARLAGYTLERCTGFPVGLFLALFQFFFPGLQMFQPYASTPAGRRSGRQTCTGNRCFITTEQKRKATKNRVDNVDRLSG